MLAVTDISIVICTRDRSAIFAETCESLCMLDAPGVRWEVVIVDNASSDETRQVALSLRERLPRPVLLNLGFQQVERWTANREIHYEQPIQDLNIKITNESFDDEMNCAGTIDKNGTYQNRSNVQ